MKGSALQLAGSNEIKAGKNVFCKTRNGSSSNDRLVRSTKIQRVDFRSKRKPLKSITASKIKLSLGKRYETLGPTDKQFGLCVYH